MSRLLVPLDFDALCTKYDLDIKSGKMSRFQEDIACSVITPVLPGHSSFIEQCKASVEKASQSKKCIFSKVNHIIIDGVDAFSSKAAGRNLGTRKALKLKSEWLFFLDADDILVSNAFDILEPYINTYDAVWGQIYTFKSSDDSAYKLSGQLESTCDIKDILFIDPSLTINIGHLIRREVAIETLFNEQLGEGEDFDQFLRVWSKYRCIKIPYPLCAKRINGDSVRPDTGCLSRSNAASKQVLKQFKSSNIKVPLESNSEKHANHYIYMDIAIFGIMRSGTTLMSDLLTARNKSIIIYEPTLLYKHFTHQGTESFEYEKFMKQLQEFGLDVSGMRYWNKKEYPSFIQFFNSNIYPLLSRLKFWGVKIVEFEDWEGFVTAFKPKKLILNVRDVRDVVLSAFDLALRLNRLVVDEAWIEKKAFESCRELVRMAQLPHLLVRYEDLCSDKDLSLRVAQFAEMGQLNFERPSFETTVPYRRFELEKHGKNISGLSVYRHRSEPAGPALALANRVWQLCPEYSKVFGYEVPSDDFMHGKTGNRFCESSEINVSDVNRAALNPSKTCQINLGSSRRAARIAATEFIPVGSTVLDLNCGTTSLEPMLKEDCSYIPCDVVSRDKRIIKCDFNQALELPQKDGITIVVVNCLLEYINDVEGFLIALRRYNLPIIITYHPADLTGGQNRLSFGWVNHLNCKELLLALDKNGFKVACLRPINKFQLLFQIIPKS